MNVDLRNLYSCILYTFFLIPRYTFNIILYACVALYTNRFALIKTFFENLTFTERGDLSLGIDFNVKHFIYSFMSMSGVF